MNLDELQSVRSRERQADSPQNLRSTFYQDAAEFIEDLRTERDRAAERADDPFASPEVRRLTDDIETARSTVEAIYERRVGKVVKRASIAAAGMPTERDGLTEEEQELFDALVDRIEASREHVLDEVLESGGSDVSFNRDDDGPGGADPSADGEPAPEVESGPAAAGDSEPVDAADLMGGDDDGEPAPEFDRESQPGSGDEGDTAPAGGDESPTPDADDADAVSVDRTTVRITSDVGEIFGVDERSYELASEDVVSLPEANAEPLVEKDAAEKLD